MERILKKIPEILNKVKIPSNNEDLQIINVPISTKTLLEFLPEMLKRDREVRNEQRSL